MNNTLLVAFISIFTAIVGHTAELAQPLLVSAPEPWRVEYKGDEGIPFYTLTHKEGEAAMLIISRWLGPGGKETIPPLIESIAKKFITMSETDERIKLATKEYKIEPINGDVFSGSFALFSLQDGLVQTIFLIGDENEIWVGQFTGKLNGWIDALEIVKNLKENSNQTPDSGAKAESR